MNALATPHLIRKGIVNPVLVEQEGVEAGFTAIREMPTSQGYVTVIYCLVALGRTEERVELHDRCSVIDGGITTAEWCASKAPRRGGEAMMHSLDHLVGSANQGRWNVDTQGLRDRQVDAKFELCRLGGRHGLFFDPC
jgi:hypothetical protein